MTDGEDTESAEGHAYNRAARVVTGWVRDPEFHDAEGQPAALDDDAPQTHFSKLVRRYSGDMPVRGVLDELIRTGIVAETDDRRVHLLKRAYLPAGDDAQSLYLVGSNVGDLLETLNHNLSGQGPAPRFQRALSYDNVPEEALEEWRPIAAERSQALLEELDRILSRYDRDVSGETSGTGCVRTGAGIFYLESPFENPQPRRKPDEIVDEDDDDRLSFGDPCVGENTSRAPIRRVSPSLESCACVGTEKETRRTGNGDSNRAMSPVGCSWYPTMGSRSGGLTTRTFPDRP